MKVRGETMSDGQKNVLGYLVMAVLVGVLVFSVIRCMGVVAWMSFIPVAILTPIVFAVLVSFANRNSDSDGKF